MTVSTALEKARAGAAALLAARRAVDTARRRADALRAWFGASKIVDDDGDPLVMYHGSYKDFAAFDRMASAWRGPSIDMVGSWFSSNPGDGGAGMYASGAGAAIYPVYLRVERPRYFDTFRELLNAMHEAEGRDPAKHSTGKGSPEGLREQLKAQGYDGIALSQTNVGEQEADLGEVLEAIKRARDEEFSVPKADRQPYTAKRERLEGTAARLRQELAIYGGSTEFDRQMVVIVFEPGQIKSAIGNSGAFDPGRASIIDSAGPVLDGLSAIERARTAAALAAKVKDYAAAAGASALERIRLARDIRELVAKLGGDPAAPVPAEVRRLLAIARGEHDNETLPELFGLIQEAMSLLNDAGQADEAAAQAANAAITRWAELEEKANV